MSMKSKPLSNLPTQICQTLPDETADLKRRLRFHRLQSAPFTFSSRFTPRAASTKRLYCVERSGARAGPRCRAALTNLVLPTMNPAPKILSINAANFYLVMMDVADAFGLFCGRRANMTERLSHFGQRA